MDIVLVGSGNVATHVGGALLNAGHRVVQVYSPTKAHAQTLADGLNATVIDDLAAVQSHADAYIIAVKDDAIVSVVEQLPSPLSGVVMHTAGSVDIGVLAPHAVHYGVLYPVQTFSKLKAIDFTTIPIALEASDDETYHRLAQLAGSLSNWVFKCDSRQRLSLHVAAVFACNFTNHLYAIAADLLGEHGLDFDLIRPLILETAEKAMTHPPSSVQTGPAVRHDQQTMQKHLALLNDNPELRDLYEKMSRRIGDVES